MVQDEPKESDNIYKMSGFQIIINKEEEKEIAHVEIDYQKDWWGEDFIVTAGF